MHLNIYIKHFIEHEIYLLGSFPLTKHIRTLAWSASVIYKELIWCLWIQVSFPVGRTASGHIGIKKKQRNNHIKV